MKRRIDGPALAVLAPGILLVAVAFIVPLASLVVGSFTSDAGSLGNYERLAAPAYVRVGVNTVLLTLAATAGCVLIGTPVAFVFTRAFSSLLARVVAILLIASYLMSSLVRAYAWFLVFVANGPGPAIAEAFGADVTSLLHNRWVVIVGMMHYLLPIYVLITYSGLRKVPFELVTVARTLGATYRTALRSIYLPLAGGSILTASTVVFIIGTGFFLVPDLLGGPGETMLSQLVAQMIQEFGDLGFASAAGIALVVVVLALVGVSRLALVGMNLRRRRR